MNKHLIPLILATAALAVAFPFKGYADSTNAAAKVTLQSSYLNVLGPITASTGTTSNISSGWQTVLSSSSRTANGAS